MTMRWNQTTIQVRSLLLALGAAANTAGAQTPKVAPRTPFVTGSQVLFATDWDQPAIRWAASPQTSNWTRMVSSTRFCSWWTFIPGW